MKIRECGIFLFFSLLLQTSEVSASSSIHNDISVKLFKVLLKSTGANNLIFSPYSIRHALGMAASAARRSTQVQLGKGPETLPVRKAKLQLASRLWIQNGIPVSDSFMDVCDKNYKDRPWFVDFTQAPDFLKNRVNGWVEEKTSGKIQNFISEDSIDPSMKMFLSSALYFSAEWQKPFEGDRNRVGDFNVSRRQTVKTKLLRISGAFNYFESSSLQVIEIPYQDNELSLVLFLPREGQDLEDLESSINPEVIEGWVSHLTQKEMTVILPKFELESSLELSGAMKTLGITDAFTPGAADFSAMTPKKDLYLDRFYHKTALSVSASETVAASSSSTGTVSRGPASANGFFEANRPFLFGIRHKGAHTFVLLGRFIKPISPSESDT